MDNAFYYGLVKVLVALVCVHFAVKRYSAMARLAADAAAPAPRQADETARQLVLGSEISQEDIKTRLRDFVDGWGSPATMPDEPARHAQYARGDVTDAALLPGQHVSQAEQQPFSLEQDEGPLTGGEVWEGIAAFDRVAPSFMSLEEAQAS